MKKTASIALATLLLALIAVPAAAQTAPRIGFINSQRLLEEAPGTREAREAFDKDRQGYEKQIQEMDEELTQMLTQFQQRQTMLSAEARRQEEAKIREKQAEFQERVMQIDNEAARRQQELFAPLMDRIQQAIDQIRVEGNFSIILDSASGVFASADPALDLTEQVLARLRSTANR